MVARAALGLMGHPFEMDVERGKIMEFALAVKASHPEHFEGDTPMIHPTFLTTQFHWENFQEGANPWAQVQMSQRRGMHAEQEYIFHGPPPRAWTRLTCQSRIDQIFEKQSRSAGVLTFVVMVTEYRDASGRLVAEARLTGVETEKPPEVS